MIVMFRCKQWNPVKKTAAVQYFLFIDFLLFCNIYNFLLLSLYCILNIHGVLNYVYTVSKQLITYLKTNKYILRSVNGIYRLFPR